MMIINLVPSISFFQSVKVRFVNSRTELNQLREEKTRRGSDEMSEVKERAIKHLLMAATQISQLMAKKVSPQHKRMICMQTFIHGCLD